MTDNTTRVISTKIPSNQVTFIEGWDGWIVLWKDWKVLIVTILAAPGSYAAKSSFTSDAVYELGLVQSMLSELKFGEANRVYLVAQPGGGYKAVHKPFKILGRPLECTVFAPLVDLKDIEVVRWIRYSWWAGLWKGRKVDVWLTRDEQESRELECETEGHRLMELAGLKDLTLEFVGHVMNGDAIVGIMVEPAIGRVATVEDRALVLEAIGRLQRARIIHYSVHWSTFCIGEDNKVRIRYLRDLVDFKEGQDDIVTEEAKHWHWELAEQAFEDIENEYAPLTYPETGFWALSSATDLPALPSVPKPIYYQSWGPGNLQFLWINWMAKKRLVKIDPQKIMEYMGGGSSSRGRTRRALIAPDFQSGEGKSEEDKEKCDDERLSNPPPSLARKTQKRTKPQAKHDKRTSTPSRKLLLGPEDALNGI